MARILIVDDEPQIRDALGHLLQGMGHECAYAASATQARAALKAVRSERMLRDINMPGESGLELARQVLKEHADLAVVMATAVDDADVAEFAQIKTHPDMGHRILSGSSSPLLELGAVIALTHHEKYDGSGYPRRLAGEATPIESRIAAVADVFDALTSNRVYRDAWSLEKILELLNLDKGSHFDPLVVDMFLDSIDEVLEIKSRYADGSEALAGGEM